MSVFDHDTATRGWLTALLLFVALGCEGGCEQLKQAQVKCAHDAASVTADSHALCNDSALCNGIEWCDPDHPLRDARNCVVTDPCDTQALHRLLGATISRMCHEPAMSEVGTDDNRPIYGAPFRACRIDGCEEDDCYDPEEGLRIGGALVVEGHGVDQGVLPHVDGFDYDLGCLRAVCTSAICGPWLPCESDNIYCNGTEMCEAGIGCVHSGNPCDERRPMGSEGQWVCIESDHRCEWRCTDADGDGHGRTTCGGDDCDDGDPDRFPGAPEVCDPDGIDEDCDPRTIGDLDADFDGYVDANCTNYTEAGDVEGTDCNDSDPAIHLGQNEVCNAKDDDCDGDVDEGVLVEQFTDADGDGFGAPGTGVLACPGVGLSFVAGDCDDENPQIIPGAIVCADPGNPQIPTYDLCAEDGTFTKGNCAGTCIGQPGGTGVCH